MVDTKV
jgi:hypothetical protein